MSASAAKRYRPETRLVHAGILRSQFGENAETLYLTQSYIYESAASAEKRFKGEEPGYIYSRYGNPTVSMFEARMCALEGAQAARATATGMAAVTTALVGQLRAGDHVTIGTGADAEWTLATIADPTVSSTRLQIERPARPGAVRNRPVWRLRDAARGPETDRRFGAEGPSTLRCRRQY